MQGNSSAPATEAAVVARHSHGRQIGRISDALYALIQAEYAQLPASGPLANFVSMWKEVDALKADTALARVEQLSAGLALLQRTNEPEYRRLRQALEQALASAPQPRL